MKVQITTPSLGGIQSDGTRGHKFARDKAGQPSRQAFLVSILDSAGVNPAALAFSTVDERGVDIPAGAFRGAYEMWFDIADAQKIVAKLGKLTPNQVLFFEFTPTFGPSSRGKVAEGSGANEGILYQTITIGADRFQARKFSVGEAPGIEGLD